MTAVSALRQPPPTSTAKQRLLWIVRGVVVSLSFGFLVGCGDPEENASASLADLGYRGTVGDYLLAAETGDLRALELFHEAGIAVDALDEAGDTALMRAAATGKEEVIQVLLDAGADPHLISQAGRTALMNAAESGQAEVLELLLARGGDFQTRDAEGWTALKLAAFHGRADVVEILAERVDQDLLDQALLVASFQGDTAVIDQLINHGAYINTRSPENMTPLMISAQAGNEDAVKLLLQNQANPYALDDSERTAADLASAAGFEDLGMLLLDPTSMMEMAESGVDSDDLLVGEDPLLAEAAIAEALPALQGGEASGLEGLPFGDGVEGESTGTTSARNSRTTSRGGSPRLASINGKLIGEQQSSRPDSPQAEGASEVLLGSSTSESSSTGSAAGSVGGSEEPSSDPVRSMRMKHYREEPLPVMLKGVEVVESESGAVSEVKTAKIRVLSRPDPRPVPVRAGEIIPGTTLRVARVESRFISSKMGKGELLDVSSILVEDTRNGSKHMLVKDVPGRSSRTYATVTVPGSHYEYVVKNGDTFRALTSAEDEQEYEVLEVRPTQVVIRNVGADEVMTVNREGLAMR